MTTTPNPIRNKLGFNSAGRLVIIHIDDIGMYQASISAFSDLPEADLVSSGTVMMPCAWAFAAVAYCRQHAEVDMGIHATLTSKWPLYRWGPISTHQSSSGLIDSERFFYSSSEEAQEHADARSARQELAAQLQQAIKWAIQPIHIDTHMGTIAHPKVMQAYIEVGLQHGIPPMLLRLDEEEWLAVGIVNYSAKKASTVISELEEQGIPVVDHLVGMRLNYPADRLQRMKQALVDLQPGVTHFIIHPSKDTPGLRAITPDWACRVADYRFLTKQALRDFLKDSGLHVIGYQRLQQLLPAYLN